MDPTWSQLLSAYIKDKGFTVRVACAVFGACPSQIHNWTHSSEPRDDAVLKSIERKTGGAVPASAVRWSPGKKKRGEE